MKIARTFCELRGVYCIRYCFVLFFAWFYLWFLVLRLCVVFCFVLVFSFSLVGPFGLGLAALWCSGGLIFNCLVLYF